MQRMQFFGVRTVGSLALQCFPRWAQVLGVGGAVLEGVDLPLGDDLTLHRASVKALRAEEAVRGALVTSHKLSVVRAAGDLIDRLTPEAAASQEVSALYKRDGLLWGHACDPANCGLALGEFLGRDYWERQEDAEVLSLGGGGAAVALLLYLLRDAPRKPRRLIIVDKREDNLAHCQEVARAYGEDAMPISFVRGGDPVQHDKLVASLPPHSLVINATGMGKDVPGSPVSDAVRFPLHGAAWELNYRGARPFLQQALAQQKDRKLRVTDGWHYFMHGWSSVMSLVFDVEITPAIFAKFCQVSESLRP